MVSAPSIFRISLVCFGNIHAEYERDARRISFVQVLLFAGTRDVVRALNDRLHPPQTSITRWTDLSGIEILGREFDEPVGALVRQQISIPAAGPNRFAFPLDINKIIVHRNCALSEFG